MPLIKLLLDFGAAIEGRGTRKWGRPLFTALAFGMSDAAAALAKRGARVSICLTPPGSAPATPPRVCCRLPTMKRATARSLWLRSTDMQRLSACCWRLARIPIDTTRKATTRTRHRCIRPCSGAMRRWCGFSSNAARGSISATRSGAAPRSAGRSTAAERHTPGWMKSFDRLARERMSRHGIASARAVEGLQRIGVSGRVLSRISSTSRAPATSRSRGHAATTHRHRNAPHEPHLGRPTRLACTATGRACYLKLHSNPAVAELCWGAS